MTAGAGFIYKTETGSTNTDARILLQAGDPPEGTIVQAGFQMAGRGRKGNKWESNRNENLLFSIIFYPKMLEPSEQFNISMAVSLGIRDYLETMISDCKIKWPNDILAGNRKIAGILIENTLSGSSILNTIAGIGLNINQERFQDYIPPATSLKMLTGKNYDLQLSLKELYSCIDKRYVQMTTCRHDQLREEYITRLYRLNEWHTFISDGAGFKGKIKSVDESGCLVLETESGRFQNFSFGEIKFTY